MNIIRAGQKVTTFARGITLGGTTNKSQLEILLSNFAGGDEVIFTNNVYGGTGMQYFLSQHIGNRLYWRIQVVCGNINIGEEFVQLNSTKIYEYYRGYNLSTTPAITHGANTSWSANATYPGGGYMNTNGGGAPGEYLQLVTDANCTTAGALVIPGVAPWSSMCLVTIDGDNTLADLLPTAQQLVDGGSLAATALVAGGGTLNPTDRIMDCYNLAANYTDPRTAACVFFSKTLAAGVHTIRVNVTIYNNVLANSPASYALVCALFAGGANAAGATGTDAIPVFVSKQNTNTVNTPHRWEISYSFVPTGEIGHEWLGHSGSLKIKALPTINVDGTPLVPTDYVAYPGSEIILTTQNNVRHTETGGNDLGVLDLIFTLNKATGMTIDHTLTWATTGLANGYPCMLSLDHAVFDRFNCLGSGIVGTDLTDNDDVANFNSAGQAAFCWDLDGYQAIVMSIPNLVYTVENWTKAPVNKLWWADISSDAGAWKKTYATRFKDDEAYTATTVWGSKANYRVAWIISGADAVFGGLM